MEPQKIGRYEVKAELGRGGMALVYLCYDPHVGREVAVKVLLWGLSLNAKFLNHINKEAKFMAKLEHPAIVPIYDIGVSNGNPYFVMRYMRGGPWGIGAGLNNTLWITQFDGNKISRFRVGPNS
jgi:serine/threonine-protein kinase